MGNPSDKVARFLIVLLVLLVVADCSGGGGGGPGGGVTGGGTGAQVVTGIGTPSGAATTASIDSTGGTVSDAGGSFVLTIPAGALPGPTQITVTPLSSSTTPWQTTSSGFGVTGLASLTKPATMSVKYTGSVQSPSADTLAVALQTASGAWWYFGAPTWDGVSSMVVTLDPATLSTLSGVVLAAGTALDAASLWVIDRIYMRGRTDLFVNDTENYEAAACNPQALNSGNEALLSFTDGTCQTLQKSLSDVTWLVNGKPNGDSTVGTIQNQCNPGCGGHYTAPATVPANNPVSIDAIYNVTTTKIDIGKNVTIHGFGKFSVKAGFREDKFPVCQGAAPTLMTDEVDFNLEAQPPIPFYSVTAIKDTAAVYSQPLSPSTDVTLTVDPGPEIFLQTQNITAVLTDGQPPLVQVTINGTGRTAQCTYRDANKGTLLTQEPSLVAAGEVVTFQFDPDPKKFTQPLGGGPHQIVNVGPWQFEVIEAF